MADPVTEDEFSGQVRIRCDYETYLAFWKLSKDYYNYEDTLRDLLKAAEENPSNVRASDVNLGLPESDTSKRGWG